jgi:hypothetical protein
MSGRGRTALALTVTLVCLGLGSASIASAEEAWCGDSSGDWACRLTGKVEVSGHATQERSVPPDSVIATFAHAQAHVTFASEAWCTLGGSGIPSSMLTRPPGEGTLFRLSRGSSSCFNPTGEGAVEVLCVKGEECPVEVEARGVSLIRVDPSGTATASSAAVMHRAARIISCGGYVRVALASKAAGTGSSDEDSGTGSYGRPFEIFVSQTIESSDLPDDTSLRVENTSVSRTLETPGLCASEPIREVDEASSETITVVSTNGSVTTG